MPDSIRNPLAVTVALAVIEVTPVRTNEPNAVTVPVAVILAEANAIEPPVADTIAVPVMEALLNCILLPNADKSAKPFITAVPNTNEPLVVTVTVAVAFILAEDVLKRVPEALTVASAVIAADASNVLPANELKGAWEKLAMPNISTTYFCL